MLSGLAAVLIMIMVVIIAIMGVVVYRIIMFTFMCGALTGFWKQQATTIVSVSGATVNFLLILLLGHFYQLIAEKLTEWEMHRTQVFFLIIKKHYLIHPYFIFTV